MDLDPYSPVRSEVAKTKHGKIMLLSSFDDFYSIRSNFDSRREFGETHVERGYDKVLSAASLGDESFSAYLINIGVTHVLVPLSTSLRGEIRYRWGELGSIRESMQVIIASPSRAVPVSSECSKPQAKCSFAMRTSPNSARVKFISNR